MINITLTKRCDRCGKLYDLYPNRKHPGKYNSIKFVRVNNIGTIDHECDCIGLCPECIEYLYSWYINFESEETKND